MVWRGERLAAIGAALAGQPEEAARWLAWLDRLAADPHGDAGGWDPVWSRTDGAVQPRGVPASEDEA